MSTATSTVTAAAVVTPSVSAANPLLSSWSSEPFGLPPFSRIEAGHFRPAFTVALGLHVEEATAIAADPSPPTFENTVRAFDRSGELLSSVSRVLDHLCASATSPALQEVELAMAPILAAHSSKIMMLPGLFTRVDVVHTAREMLPLEAARLTERTWLDFVRAGARFGSTEKARYAAVVEELAALTTQFSQNVLADEAAFTISLNKSDLDGCPPDVVAAARQAALERGGDAATADSDAHVITLSRSLVEPFLTYATDRALRERAWRAWTRRGELSPDRDNIGLVKKILMLRSEQAALHGKVSFGAFQTEDMMAKSPDRVSELLLNVWPRARAAAEAERASLESFSGLSPIEPWDWRFYAERLRAEQYSFDDAVLKPYMSLPAMQRAVFDVANKLFGLRFIRRADIAGYHADCEVYEVRETIDGVDELVGIFIADNFARPNKQGGAWMSELRTASRDGERVLPVICNNNNFSRGDPTLLTFDDATTLFHEFGHGLHGLLSAATYRGLAGTSVLRDFVEMPSQLLENWLSEAAVLRVHARHFETGEVVPDALLEKLRASKNYGSGFATVEYTSCALVDQALHALPASELEVLDVNAFETATLARLGMPQGIVLRHRLPHFSHLFASSGYASAYYVYMWCVYCEHVCSRVRLPATLTHSFIQFRTLQG